MSEQFKVNEEMRYIGVHSDSAETVRQIIYEGGSCTIDLIKEKVTWLENLPEPFLEIIMPCGTHKIYPVKDIPKKSVRCPCGDQLHWLIKYDDYERWKYRDISQN
jgi:hypothetical protein